MTSYRHRNHCYKQPKQRMRPWLIDLINSGSIPGLIWVDKSQMIFRVPWKHGSRQNWKQSDANLYIRWAQHRGKYNPSTSAKPNTKKFKATFRCALNSLPDCEEIVEKSQKTGQDAFKIYKFNEWEKKKSSKIQQKEEDEQMSKDSYTSEERMIPNDSDTNSSDILPKLEELFHSPLKAPFPNGGFYSVEEDPDEKNETSAQEYFDRIQNTYTLEMHPPEYFFDEANTAYTEVIIHNLTVE